MTSDSNRPFPSVSLRETGQRPGVIALQRFAGLAYRWFPYFYLAIAACFVLALCYLQPPFEVADEPQHFFRACQVSFLDFLPHARPRNAVPGAFLPLKVNRFVKQELAPGGRAGHRGSAISTEQTNEHVSPDTPVFISMVTVILYNPAYYAPQAAGIAIARLFSTHVYTWFYGARIVNGLTAVLAVFFALLLSRDQQFILAFIALLPMSLSQMASVSPDAWLFAMSILFVSACIRLSQFQTHTILPTGRPTERPVRFQFGTRATASIVAITAIWLIAGRPVVFPIVLLPLVAYSRIGWRRALGLSVLIAVLSAAVYLAWSVQTRSALSGEIHVWESNPAGQLACLAKDPVRFIQVLWGTLSKYGASLFRELIGVLGWLTANLPGWYYSFTTAALVLLVFVLFNWDRLVSWAGVIVLVSIGATVVATCLSIYVLFSPVCADAIEGLQGRYFFPPLVFIALLCRGSLLRAPLTCIVACLLTVLFAAVTVPVTAHTLVRDYYGAHTSFCSVLPQGEVDAPPDGSTVSGRLTLTGSASASQPIDRIEIFIDDFRKQSLPVHFEIGRWSTVINLEALPPGKHEIVVQAGTTAGCTFDIGDFFINTPSR